MLTRALLLLLAMMTGLSAAQAAETVLPANAPVAQEASSQLSELARAGDDAELRRATAAWCASQPMWPELECRGVAHHPVFEPAPAPAATVHRSDRARE